MRTVFDRISIETIHESCDKFFNKLKAVLVRDIKKHPNDQADILRHVHNQAIFQCLVNTNAPKDATKAYLHFAETIIWPEYFEMVEALKNFKKTKQ